MPRISLLSGRWSGRTLFALVLFFGLLAMTARSATDPDLWWHLRSGQWIVETGHVPRTDPFSFTRAGQPWVAHEWLSEVIFYELSRLGGVAALIIFSSLVTTAGFLLLYWRCRAAPQWAAAATLLGAWAAAPCWGTRPQMFTFTLASLLLWLLEQAEARPGFLFWIPPIFVVWVNLHGGFAIGPVLILLYAAGLASEAAAGTTDWSEARAILGRVLLTALACLALVPLNPQGVHFYRYPLDTVRQAEMRVLIVEWLSPDFHRSMYLPCLLVMLLLVVALAWSRLTVKGRVLLPLVFMLISALDAVRHIQIFILIAVPVIAAATTDWSGQRHGGDERRTDQRRADSRLRLRLNQGIVVALVAFVAWRWTFLIRAEPAREAALYPKKAVEFLRGAHLPSRLFAYYDWGGYGIYTLYPEYRVFVDGRTDLYGSSLLSECQTADLLHNGWEAILDRWQVDTILIPADFALAQGLWEDFGWRSAYGDTQAVIFVRNPQKQGVRGVTSGTMGTTSVQ